MDNKKEERKQLVAGNSVIIIFFSVVVLLLCTTWIAHVNKDAVKLLEARIESIEEENSNMKLIMSEQQKINENLQETNRLQNEMLDSLINIVSLNQ